MRTMAEVGRELEAAAPQTLHFGVMPSSEQLLEAGRSDLVVAIRVRRWCRIGKAVPCG